MPTRRRAPLYAPLRKGASYEAPFRGIGEANNPQFADFPRTEPTALDMLREVARALAHIERSVGELPAGAEVEIHLETIEQSLGAIRRAIQRRGGNAHD